MNLPLTTAVAPTAAPTTAGTLVQSFSAAAFERLRASVTAVNNSTMATIAPGTGQEHSHSMLPGDIIMTVIFTIAGALMLGGGGITAYRCVSRFMSYRSANPLFTERDSRTRDPVDATGTQRPDVAIPAEPPPSYAQSIAMRAAPPSYAQATASEPPPQYA